MSPRLIEPGMSIRPFLMNRLKRRWKLAILPTRLFMRSLNRPMSTLT
ncbi:hypothetical protein [Halomonas sp.]